MRDGERSVWIQWTEAANLLGMRQGQILRLIEDKRLHAEETSGGIVMVRRADVERLREELRERRAAMLGGS